MASPWPSLPDYFWKLQRADRVCGTIMVHTICQQEGCYKRLLDSSKQSSTIICSIQNCYLLLSYWRAVMINSKPLKTQWINLKAATYVVMYLTYVILKLPLVFMAGYLFTGMCKGIDLPLIFFFLHENIYILQNTNVIRYYKSSNVHPWLCQITETEVWHQPEKSLWLPWLQFFPLHPASQTQPSITHNKRQCSDNEEA